MLFEFFGGLGIFLFGLKFMGDGLQRSAGDNLRSILNKFTSNPFRAILAGMVVTVIIQSSSATTVLTVGLVSAGFMSLKQAIGVVMGANIGTTVTAFIIGINISAYSLPIIAIGSLLLFFTKKELINNMGEIIFGFGALFFGLELMGNGMAPLETLPQFRELMLSLSHNPILGVSLGTVLTLLVQSSSALIGIIQELYTQGSITLEAALPMLFGSNIGTTITAILAAIGTSVAARRTSASHVVFNLVGTILVMLVLNPFSNVVRMVGDLFQLNPAMQLAFAHGLFNVVNVLIQMWFISQIAALVTKIIPGEEKVVAYDDKRLDFSMVQTSPALALNQAKLEIVEMGEVVKDEFGAVFSYFKTPDEKVREKALQLEEIVNEIDMKLTEYLTVIAREELPAKSSEEHTTMVDITKYLERIGDHSESILKNIKDGAQIDKRYRKENDEKETRLFDEDLVHMFELVELNIQDAIQSFSENRKHLAEKVLVREKEINALEIHLRAKYIERLNAGIGQPSDGILFVDIVSNLERMSDHTVKIAKHTLGYRYPFSQSKVAEVI
ncbi:Na/Pi cotransporter family protein [Jeotgalibaca ciconiae]|uniref:Na/Pi cotransporter family protein n=2 Tax=Jeotgalibaca ciconiae TaxID=2496265 RepID=A0A3Q9BMF1_9LACT|nr:Na/Pi cotransporter family protein [Jeotgalibaca ciconiae]